MRPRYTPPARGRPAKKFVVVKAKPASRQPKGTPQKESIKMGDHEQFLGEEAAKRKADQKARGAGSGENATKTRSRSSGGDDEDAELPKEMFPEGKSESDYEPDSYKPESDYPEGEAAKGMPDYNELAKGVQQYIPMRDYRAYLVSQAEKNERANDEIQAKFIEGMKAKQKVYGILNNPDFMRDTSMESVLAQMKTSEQSKEYIENFKKQRMKEQQEAAKASK